MRNESYLKGRDVRETHVFSKNSFPSGANKRTRKMSDSTKAEAPSSSSPAKTGGGDWGAAADEQEKSLVNKVGGLHVNGAGKGDAAAGGAAAAAGAGKEGEGGEEKPLSPAEQSLLRKVSEERNWWVKRACSLS